MPHEEFERAFEHSVIFALDDDIQSESGFADEFSDDAHSGPPPTESVSGGAQKSADIPSWADEGERTELLDGEMFSDIEVLAATSENESQDNESIDENTLLFSTPLMAQPTRLGTQGKQTYDLAGI